MWKLSSGVLLGIALSLQYVNAQVARKVANNLDVEYSVRTNFAVVARMPHSAAVLTLTNKGAVALPDRGYSINFCHENFLFPVSYQEELGKYESAPYGGELLVEGFYFRFLHGCMYEMKAIDAALQPKESKNITLYYSPFIVSKFDVFRNWYVTDDSGNSVIIDATRNRGFVDEFKTPLNQLRRTDDLDSVPKEPQDRQNAFVPFMNGVLYDVTPKPRSQQIATPTNLVDVTATKNAWKIFSDAPTLADARDYLSAETKIPTAQEASGNPNTIKLSLKPVSSFPVATYGPITAEAYELVITPTQIEISAATPKGIINGIHTFISQQAWREVPAQVIKDGPRFAERALQLDIASNFYKPAEIKKIIDLMAYYKLNRLYLQLWNNHGLRLDLGLGAAEVAGKRCHDLSEQTCLLTQLGSKPDGTGKGNGYLTAKQFENLLKYAEKRGVMIVPSINIGDNARAMVVGMDNAIKKGNVNAASMSLFDESEVDDLRMSGRYPRKDSAINPCRPETVAFVDYLLRYLSGLYVAAGQQLNRLHFASDFNTEQMMTSKHCFPTPPRNGTELQAARSRLTAIKADFLEKMGQMFTQQGVDISGTVDFFTGFPDNQQVSRMTIMDKDRRYRDINAYVVNDDYMRLIPPTSPQAPMEFFSNRAQLLKNNGYRVLVSPPHKTKFDTAYEPDPNAPGDYSVATRNVSLREAFTWTPNSRCCNLNLAPEQVAKEVTKHGCLTEPLCTPFNETVNGFDGTMATIDTRKLSDLGETLKLLSIRIMAFAERSWHEAPWEDTFTASTPYQPPQRGPNQPPALPPLNVEPTLTPDLDGMEQDFQRFRSLIGAKEVMRMASKGVPVFCSAPGAKVVADASQPGGNKLETSCMYPNMKVYYKTPMDQYVEMTAAPTENVTIKCLYHIEQYRQLFDCYEQEFNKNLDKTPFQHVQDHITQREIALRREQEAMRAQQQQAMMAQQAMMVARQRAALLQQQQQQQQQGGGQQAGQMPGGAGVGQQRGQTQGRRQGGARGQQGAGGRGIQG